MAPICSALRARTRGSPAASDRRAVSRSRHSSANRPTIAALSSGVPTGGIAYSDKMTPVFAGLGQGTTVDARTEDSDAIVGRLAELWRDRDAARRSLAAQLPGVLDRTAGQMAAILEATGDGVGA